MGGSMDAGFYVDIVLCVDVSGSMKYALNKLKDVILSRFERFIDSFEDERSQCISALRVKFIAFRDYYFDDDPMIESRFYNLPEENGQFVKDFSLLEAKDGGDRAENALEALAIALKSDWTSDGGVRRHCVVLLSDAPALPLGARKDCVNYPEGMPVDFEELASWWAGTNATLQSSYRPKSGRLIACGIPESEPWTEMQTWNRSCLFFSRSGSRETDWDSWIDILVESI